ncbi:conserved hypothetical protein [Ricinus communis]|uniref:Uncharacterized protein n=1 Tax=Ricinus communis TaxID=3988 RepID=B9SM82_RICCO|nr:conserved hypothetical protein [Ricinus communis]
MRDFILGTRRSRTILLVILNVKQDGRLLDVLRMKCFTYRSIRDVKNRAERKLNEKQISATAAQMIVQSGFTIYPDTDYVSDCVIRDGVVVLDLHLPSSQETGNSSINEADGL